MGCASSGTQVVELNQPYEETGGQQTVTVKQSVLVNDKGIHQATPSEALTANHSSAINGRHTHQETHQQQYVQQQYRQHSHQQPHQQSHECSRLNQPHAENSTTKGGSKKKMSSQQKREMLEKMKMSLNRRLSILTQKEKELEEQVKCDVAASKHEQVVKNSLENILKIRKQIERNEMLQAKIEQTITDRMIFQDNYDMGGFMQLMSLEIDKVTREYDVAAVQVAATRLAQAEDRFLVGVQVGEDAVETGLEYINADII